MAPFNGLWDSNCEKMKCILDRIGDIQRSWSSPWAIGGDFNTIKFVYEKPPPGVLTMSKWNLNSFIQSQGLRDSSPDNASSTWTDGQEVLTMSRLDRFFIANCWGFPFQI